MMHLQCACGAALQVSELYAGGQVLCQSCGAAVLVPSDWNADDKFRFHCPHCETRVVARKTSAGKKSQCPACEKVYIVPEPPPETDLSASKESRRIEIGTDELALRVGLPFPVGKLEPTSAEPPRPRFLHDPSADPHEFRPPEPPLPARVLPERYTVDSPTIRPPQDEPSVSVGLEPKQQFAEEETTLSAVPIRLEGAPTAEWVPIDEAPAGRSPASTAPTAAAIPEMPAAPEPASVGELQVLSGACSGQRIRLNFRRFVVGAERDCDLRPPSPHLSRHHCVFKKDEYSLRIRDLGSTDGTFVNGRRIFSEAILKPGDQVRIADVTFHVSLPRAPEIVHARPDSTPSISDFVIL